MDKLEKYLQAKLSKFNPQVQSVIAHTLGAALGSALVVVICLIYFALFD